MLRSSMPCRYFGMVTLTASTPYTIEALRTFFSNTPLDPEDKFFLIDNDGQFPGNIVADIPQFSVIRNPSPLGYAENANNLVALALAAGADLYFLNNDVIFTRNWSDQLRGQPRSILSPFCNREVRYALSVVVSNTQSVVDVFLTDMVMKLEQYSGREAAIEAIAEAHRKVSPGGYWGVYVLPFFAVKIPIDILHAVGKFDTSFGKAGAEDYDYCLRARLAGFEVEFALGSYLLHFGGKSTYSGAETREAQDTREAKFFDAFEQKWGRDLFLMILREDSSALGGSPEAKKLHESGDLRSSIVQLMRGRTVAVKI